MCEMDPSRSVTSTPFSVYRIRVSPRKVEIDEPSTVHALRDGNNGSKPFEDKYSSQELNLLGKISSSEFDNMTSKSGNVIKGLPDIGRPPWHTRRTRISFPKGHKNKSSRKRNEWCVQDYMSKNENYYTFCLTRRDSIINQYLPSRNNSVYQNHIACSNTICDRCSPELQICCEFGRKRKISTTDDLEKDLKQFDRGDSHVAVNTKCSKMIPTVFVYNIDGYEFSYLLSELNRSAVYRNMLLRKYLPTFRGSNHYFSDQIKASTLSVIFLLKPPQKGVFDPTGNQLSMSYIVEKCELDVALSWLSTLGGAFSALGDNSTTYAAEAGRVSITQLKIAMRLKDPLVASRCRLYAAISLLQRGCLKSARDIVRREYKYAKSLPEGLDPRLERMCFGVWAKLQYYWALSLMSKRGVDSFEEIFQKWSEIREKKNGKLLKESDLQVKGEHLPPSTTE